MESQCEPTYGGASEVVAMPVSVSPGKAAALLCVVGIILCILSPLSNKQSPDNLVEDERATSVVYRGYGSTNTTGHCGMPYRLQHLREGCKTLNTSLSELVNTNILVDDAHRILYTYIPKCGSTGLREAFYRATQVDQDYDNRIYSQRDGTLRQVGLHFLKDYTRSEREHRLKEYFSFIVVRHPFDRLLSAYNDKVNSTIRHFVRYFKARDRKLTFPEFLVSILQKANKKNDGVNAHWRPYHRIVDPCRIRYDAVVKMETFHEDMAAILERLRTLSGRTLRMPQRHMRRNDLQKRVDTTNMFISIDSGVVGALRDMFAYDFKLFGYSWDSRSGATCDPKLGCC